jgi:UDP-N-acetyl-D-glucosamine dehydrogenase
MLAMETSIERQSTSETYNALLQRIRTRTATVGVIGLGYVGLPLALLFSENDFPVIGFDVDRTKIDALNHGASYIRHIGVERIADVFGERGAKATDDFSRLAECDAILVCVPTPLGRHREPDLKYVRVTAEAIAKHLRRGQLVILESTTYPGTTREELLSRFEQTGMKCGVDFFVGFSPEREDPGNERFSTRSIPKIVGGADAPSRDVAVALYASVVDEVVPVSSIEVAESAKLLENIFRSVNIALVNELKVVFDRMGIDIWEVIEAAKTKPFGFMPFYPGPGLGGHCIPLDPFYLSWKAAEQGVWARFIELSGEVNASMPRYVVDKIAEALNDRGKSLNGSRVLVLGLSYKPNIDDDRESPSFEILEMLRDRGAAVAYCDPHILFARRGRKYDLGLASVSCSAKSFAEYDAVVISTAHAEFKDPSLYKDCPIVVDTRNIIPPAWVPAGRLYKA